MSARALKHLAIQHDPGIADDRAAPRHRLILSTDARRSGGEAFPVKLRDLSETGTLIEADAPMAVGTSIIVDHPTAGEIAATVTWSGNGLAGLQFARRLSAAMVGDAVRISPVIWLPTLDRPRRAIDNAADVANDPPALPVARRMQIVVGFSLALWAVIATVAVALLG